MDAEGIERRKTGEGEKGVDILFCYGGKVGPEKLDSSGMVSESCCFMLAGGGMEESEV